MLPLRDENPSHSTPFFTVILIIVNVLVFLFQASAGEAFVQEMAVLPFEITRGRNLPYSASIPPYLSLITSMFLHGGWAHLIGNMWFLWIFGDNIEDFLGHIGYLAFYFITGIAAGLTHVLLNSDSTIPTIGASGAISGILGAYIVLHPRIRVKTLVTLGFFFEVIRIPAFFFLGIWFLMQFLGGQGSGVAYGAHIGGFVAGALIILLFTKPKRDPYPVERYQSNRRPWWG